MKADGDAQELPPDGASRKAAWPLGAVIFSAALALAMTGYAVDVARKARGAADWLMIAPAAAVGVVALLVSIGEDIVASRRVAASPASDPETGLQTYRSLAFMALLAVYVGAIPLAGFDVSTFAFLAGALFLQGERRIGVCVGFAAVVTALVIVVFVNLLRVRLDTLLF